MPYIYMPTNDVVQLDTVGEQIPVYYDAPALKSVPPEFNLGQLARCYAIARALFPGASTYMHVAENCAKAECVGCWWELAEGMREGSAADWLTLCQV